MEFFDLLKIGFIGLFLILFLITVITLIISKFSKKTSKNDFVILNRLSNSDISIDDAISNLKLTNGFCK